MKIVLDNTIYSKEVLLKTAYCFTDKAYLHLSREVNHWIVEWTDKEDSNISASDFENELIVQQLREELIQKTADIRKLVLARAFASTIIDNSEHEESIGSAEQTAMESSEDERILKGWFDNDD